MDSTPDIKKEINLYIKVFGTLAVLTVLTVAAAYLDVGIGLAVIIAMIIATTKGSLVASFFMHLAHEKKLIYLMLVITLVFLLSLFFITFGTIGDQVGVEIVPEGVSSGVH
ncbi:MAG: cytochrome C oxidase subunit IV family protein [Candidatus Neomarinimicrobiota bacterium]|nr:cytochrome C oxidase subunit IV family protein [Candidatus Neomarinimicrobiota bacterium]